MTAENDLIELVRHGREERSLEYKGPENWANPAVRARLTKCILALANIQDGGAIVIGVEQVGQDFVPVGLNAADRDSFDQDHVAAHLANYADPYVEVTVSRVSYEGNDFVVIQVRQFDEIPIICRKKGQDLRGGAVYTRTRRMYECAEVPGQAEMRELLELAIEKGLRKFEAVR
jgi:predicted HTH transcriptional regulator